MAAILSRYWALSVICYNNTGNSVEVKKNATNYSCQGHNPQSTSKLRKLGLQSSTVTKDNSTVKHMESITNVKNMFMQLDDPLQSMLTVDYLQKLGIDYHFTEEINAMLGSFYEYVSNDKDEQFDIDLFQVSLSFRLLRQSGYPIYSNVFNKFTDKKEGFKSTLATDVQGLLSLYEASCLNTGEDILYKANEFSSMNLASSTKYLEPNVARLVNHTLKHPCYLTISRYNAGHYLYNCKDMHETAGILEELARLDFNLVQSLHQKELKDISSWWESTGLAEELKFARNQPLKWYMWSMTMLPDPQFSEFRIQITKIITFIYVIDDIFDNYGSPDELKIFTKAIGKWDLSVVEALPTYMQSCYSTLYNITNEVAETVFKEQGWNPINTLKKSWRRLCNAFLIESRWLQSKQIPKADEYLTNAVISSGVHTLLMHSFFLLGEGITMKNVSILESNPNIMSCPATILRLWDDLGSAKDENQGGFDGSYVDCYMKEYPQCSMKNARDHVKQIISSNWQNLNKECFRRDHFAPTLVRASLNIARMIEVVYSYDDNQNLPILEDYINVLLFKSI